MPNHPGELFTHARALWPERALYNGHLMEQWEWEAAYCEMRMTPYGQQVVGARNLGDLKARLSPVVNVIKRADVLDLPACTVDVWALDGEGEERRRSRPDIPGLLGTLEEKYGRIDEIESFDSKTLDAYLACIHAAMQMLPTVRRETAVLKAVYIGLTLREELEISRNKVVCFTLHREALSTMEKILAAFKPAVVHGDVSENRRQAEIDRFQTDPTCRVFLGQLQVAGASINLHAANEVVFVEASWTPGDNDQALSRVYRMGQTSPVRVRFAYLPDSVDEAVARAIRRKMAMISQVFA